MSQIKAKQANKSVIKKISQCLSRIFVILILLSLVLGTLLPFFLQIFGNAQVSVTPKTDSNSETQNAWNLFRLKAGESADGQVEISNLASKDVIVDVQSNDAIFTKDGFFSINSNSEVNNGVGSWLKLNKGRQAVSALSRFALPFSVTVPTDTKDGEYAGGISATEIDDSNSNSVALSKRAGSRVYVLVGTDFKIEASTNELRIIDPSSDKFGDDQKTYPEIDKNNLSFLLGVQNKGNIYAKMIADYELTLPNGEIKTGNFETSLPPDQQEYPVAINTQNEYQQGVSKLKINYRFTPQNELLKPEDVKFDADIKSIETQINLQNQDLQKLPDRQNQQSSSSDNKSQNWYKNVADWIWVAPVIIGFGVVLAVAFVIFKKTRK
jgi:hypothetical protein